MKRPKKANKKLMAMLLSMAMIVTSIPQGLQVYAAEAALETVEADEDGADNVAVEESASANEEADEEVSVSETGAANEETETDSLNGEETNTDSHSSEETEAGNAGSEAVDENGSDDVLTEEEVSVEELSSEEMSSEEASSEEEESETEEQTDEEALKTAARNASTARASGFSAVGGWNESIYAEIAGIADTDVTEVRYSGAISGALDENDLNYLVRKSGNGVRIDIPGLKAGTYTLTVKVGKESVLTESGIRVYAYDRSGYAHFKYNDGVGAYKDDGTLKENAIVLYVTDKNKNDVELTIGNTTVKGIGNILNSVGKECGEAGHEGQCKRVSGNKTYYGKANTNQGVIAKLSEENIPLVVRFIGIVSDSGLYEKSTFNASSKGLIDGLTVYDTYDNGGSPGDNGHMARIQSGKNITLEGIGYDAAIDGWGFHFMAESATTSKGFGKSFEVRNLQFINTPEDAIGMEGQQSGGEITAGVERCWIHNNEFYCPNITSPAESDKAQGDGSVDFKRGQYFTCSYNYFDGCHKTNLVGSSDSSLQYNLTFHHNHWYNCESRGPLARQANIHMYNNIVDMQSDYAQNTRANAFIFSEYNLFYASKNPQIIKNGGGPIKSYKDSFASVIGSTDGTVVTDKMQKVPNNCKYLNTDYSSFETDTNLSYIPDNNYILQQDFKELRKVVKSQTGVQSQYPKLAENVSVSEYSMLPDNAKVNTVSELPFTATPGKIQKNVYAFEVGGAFDLEVEYTGALGVLVNEAGENLLEGNGSVTDLPGGTYWIQAVNFSPNGGNPQFKDITISSLKITAHDPNAHYHKWKLDSSKSTAATCTDPGKEVYICEGTTGTCEENDGVKEETVSALGHSYGSWQVIKEATETEDGMKRHYCTRCKDAYEDVVIPMGSTGPGTGDDEVGGSTAAGDYELYFTGKKVNGDTDFFSVTGSCSEKRGPVTVNGVTYTDCLKMESRTDISFSCNDGATLFMAFDASGKKVKIDDKEYTTDADGNITVELSAGEHHIKKGDVVNLFYVALANAASEEVYYTLSFEYNYDDSPDAKTIQVIEGKSYASMSELAPESFTRRNYVLEGLYTDANCTIAITYPYVVSKNATIYANWQESDESDETTYSLIFNSNGGSAVATVRIASTQVYEIKQKPTRNGYAFAGWYDALEGGNLIDKVDGSKLTGSYTVYAHWNALEGVKLSLDCSKLEAGDIKEKTNLNNSGFIAHALEGGVGTAGEENPKYYMTVKAGGLYTNGLRLTDTSIAGNEDGLLKTIEFTTEGSGALSVEAALSGKPDTGGKYELVLIKQSSNGYEEVGRQAITTGTTKTTKEFEISGAGTYYLFAEGDKGVVYYSLKVTEQLYTIIYQTGNGTAPEDLKVSSFTARAGEEIRIPSDCTPAAGYIFKGWSADDGATILKDVYKVKEEDATSGTIIITALYEAKQFTIKYDANGGTLPAGMQATATVKTGERIILGNCTPAEGYKFLGWSLGHSGEIVKSPYIVNMADADENDTITLKAIYGPEGEEAVYYTVTLDTDGGTLVDGGGRERLVLANTAIDPGECEKVGYVFKGWTIGGKDIKLPYTVTSDVTMKARYGLSDETEQPEQRDGIYIVGLSDTYDYTGAKIIPNIGVMDYDVEGGKLLTPGVDYTVKYKDNVKAGAIATVTVTGKGNYEGQDTERTFKIEEVKNATELEDLKGVKLASIDAVPYTGEERHPGFTLIKDGIPVPYSYDSEERVYKAGETAIKANVALSNNINKGTATILISGANDSKGKPTKIKGTFKITAIDLQANKGKVNIEADAGTYAVKGAVPASISVTYDGRTLINGTDYTVKYSANKKAGQKGSVVITGKGNYMKKCTAEYDINRLNLAERSVEAVNAYDGIKAGKVTAIVTDNNGDALKPAQYTLNIYKNDTLCDSSVVLKKDDVIYVEAVAKENDVNLTGQTSKEMFTVGSSIAKAKVTLNKGVNGKTITKEYTGNPIELEASDLTVTIKENGQSKTLEMGTNYKIASYTNNTNKGTATAVIQGIGSYSGTKTIKFKITGKAIKIKESTTWDDISDSIKSFVKGLFQ